MGIIWYSVIVYVLWFLVFKSTDIVDGGSTSDFVRTFGKTIDMPLDSDVFREPNGYNAPQQVFILTRFVTFLTRLVRWFF